MANQALRQIFLEAAIEIGRRGDHETAGVLVQRVRQADAEAGQRIGRKRGSTAASRQAQAQKSLRVGDRAVTFGPLRSLGVPPDSDTELVECDVFRDGVKVGGITTDRDALEAEQAAVRAEIEGGLA